MKRKLLFILSLFGIVNLSFAKEVNPNKAKLVAKNYYQQLVNSKNPIELDLVYTSYSYIQSNSNKTLKKPMFYVFNIKNKNGFIIISGNDNAVPALGYSKKGSYDNSNLPNNFKKWIENYKNQIKYIIENNIKATNDIKIKWNKLEKGDLLNANKNTNSVNPLVSTTWGQSPYVNDLCPYDVNAGSSNGYHCVTGCPATAMAQIMKYWEYPTTGSGFHSYVHSDYGTLSANFGATTYDWSSMPNSVNSPNNAVATLMYHCGVAVEMQYGPTSSGSYVIIDASPTPEQASEYAYKTYFGYDASTIQGLKRENYSDYNWKQLLKTELDAGRPIQYAGIGQGGGHTFVCDGYDNNDYFHMNWGWSGYYDGYFLLDALNPGTGGTGAGSGSYNYNQQAVVGIQPPAGNISFDITLYDNLVANPNPVWFSSSFTIHTDVANWSSTTFNGDWTAAIFDENYNFVDYVDILSGYSLQGNSHYTNGLDFSSSGMINLLPGSYYVGIFYRPTGGNWIAVGDGSYSNFINFEVEYSNDIELYQDMIIDVGTTIEQNQAFSVTLDILNDGTNTFNGDFAVKIFDTDGYYVETVQTLTGASLDAGYYYDDVVFSTSGLNIPAGTYMLALEHKDNDGSWELSGSSYYSNPIYVTFIEQPLQPDIYENNDTENSAYNFNANFNDNSATILTTSSNLHIGSDNDYYKITLPSGYNYVITARAHDSYNSGDGNTYTCDVSWNYKINETWSENFDDVMSNNINLNNGGTIYFSVAPYFVGGTGTYLMDISITRTAVTAINNITNSNALNIYPNPTIEYLHLKANKEMDINSIKIIDILGKQIKNLNNNQLKSNEILTIPVSNLSTGSYFLVIETDKEILQHKFIIK